MAAESRLDGRVREERVREDRWRRSRVWMIARVGSLRTTVVQRARVDVEAQVRGSNGLDGRWRAFLGGR